MDREVRILIADDHPVVRRGLRQVIEAESGFQIIAETNDGQAALEELEKHKPQIAVLDMDMPRLDGLALLLNRRSRVQLLAEHHPQLNDLTPAERRVLRGIAEGKSSKQIAAELFIHFRTVETHRANICQKLGVHGHHALFKFALENKSELSGL
jgi:DNA-binding NarL/FixJ family response regulator